MAKIKEKPSRLVFVGINTLILALIAFVCFAPIWHMVMASISNPTALNTHTSLVFWPLENVDVQAYRIILQYNKLWGSYLNTILYIVSTCVLTAVLTTIAGYVFSRRSFYFRNGFMMIISFTMLFNGGMIPNYIVMKWLHLTDTPWVMIIPGALSVFNIIIMRTSMENVPMELSEAAKIDGASDLRILWSVILPLCKATFSVIMLFTAVAKWNDYFSALIYTSDQELVPLQMVLRRILLQSESVASSASGSDPETMAMMARISELMKYCVIIAASVPAMLVYPFVQKHFVKGVMLGSLKG